MDIWAKILTDEKRGQVLVTIDYDADNDKDIVKIECRGRAIMCITLDFPDEEKQRVAFNHITQDNVSEVIAGGGKLLDRIGG